MQRLIFVIFLALTGCAIQSKSMPKPAPIPCNMKINGECHVQSASEKGGAVVRGHSEEVKNVKP